MRSDNKPHMETYGEACVWWLNGKIHREDGPAIENLGYKVWYWHGKSLDCKTQEEFERWLKLKAFW